MSKKNRSGVRQLGLDVELRVVDVLNHKGIRARHAEPKEDLSGWDVELDLRGYTVHIDLTTSRARLREKSGRDDVRNGLTVVVIVSPGWSDEDLYRETLRQAVCSLPDRVKRDLLRELTT
jgi:hypothetical protein